MAGTSRGTIERANSRGRTERRLPALLRHRLQVGPQGRADVPADTSHAGNLMAYPLGPEQVGDACLLHPGPVAGPQAVRRKPGQDLAAGSPQHCVRLGLRHGRAGRCGDEMTGDLGKSQLQRVARCRHNRHLTLRRKGSEERAEGSDCARQREIQQDARDGSELTFGTSRAGRAVSRTSAIASRLATGRWPEASAPIGAYLMYRATNVN
jgi:hypothetical protein